ncbi:MAG: FliA/WhiG family RNA polymerase sigma factor [Myxococcota bacterium]
MLRNAARYHNEGARLVEGLTRDEICHTYHRKVMLLARRVYERLSSEASVELGDLVSNGAIGLLDAFDRFEESRGIKFSTFAEYRIRGQMYDALRANDTFTRRRRQEQKRLLDAQETVRRQTARDPLPQEVADYLGLTLDEYWRRVDKVKPVNIVSINGTNPDDADGRPLLEKITQRDQPEAESRMLMNEVRTHLRAAIADLPERQRQCVLMYYAKDMSLAEISEVFGVTVSRISQIISEARRALRKKLAPVVDPADLALGVDG